MNKIKAIIIDDEPRARKLLHNLLTEYCSQVEVVEQCDDLPNGVKSIRKHKADLVFLDIDMPGHSGLELLDFFDEQEVDFGIVFTTAHNQYAIKAIRLSAIDYLLKPIEPEELEKAVKRFEQNYFLKRKTEKEAPANKIAIPVGQSIKFIELSKIIFLKAENSYTEICMSDGTKLLVSRILKNFEEVFQDYPEFFRCHKSYIVNTDFLKDYVKSDGGYLVLAPNHQIPISTDKVQEFLDKSTIIRR